MSIKQDRTGTRTSEDLRRRLDVENLNETKQLTEDNEKSIKELETKVNAVNKTLSDTRDEYVSTHNQFFSDTQKEIARNNIGAGNSSFSGSYNDLSNTPQSLVDINVGEYSKLTSVEEFAEKNVIEAIKVNGVYQTVSDKEVDIIFYSSQYDLSQYKVSNLTILRSSCIEKDSRVCVSFAGTISMAANTTTTLFTFPTAIRPSITKDFVVFGQTNNNDGYIGYGYLTPDGLLQVRFNVAITSYIRFSFVYDL